MSRNPGIRRLTLIPASAPSDPVRRYRLARLEEIALAFPVDAPGHVDGNRVEPPGGARPAPRPPGS